MRTLLASLILLLPFPGAAQELTFHVNGGIGTYSMSKMKSYQADFATNFPFEPSVTDKFPPYLFFEAGCRWKPGNLLFTGFAVSYGSTGGRIQYRDYSGSLVADQLLKYLDLSVPFGVAFLHPEDKLTVYLDLKPTYNITFAELKFDQRVFDEQTTHSLRFTSGNIAVQPGIIVMRRIKQFAIHAQASYYATVMKGKLYYKEDKAAYLTDGKEPVYAQWDGMRVGLGVAVVMGSQ